MNEEAFKTLSLGSLFVFLFGALGFLVAIILNALTIYIRASSNDMYETLVQTEILATKSIPYYLLAAVLFVILGLFLVYSLKQADST
jgi:hypothetical protein